ncbi:MAG: hypothetical protein Kow0059_14490 [Candidatus Sumerlaeia bacterium]
MDNFDRRLGPEGLEALARAVCDRRFGVGADGMFLVEPSSTADIFMHFFNADGSEVGVCGNALRCISRLARHLGYVGDRFTINTIAETYEVELKGAEVGLTFPPPRGFQRDVALDLSMIPGAEPLCGAPMDLVDVGVPHLVIHLDGGVEDFDLAQVGPKIRRHPALGPQGANVNLIERRGPAVWRQRTFERGVEGETLACGSGAASSAFSASERGLEPAPGAQMDFLQTGRATLRVQVVRDDRDRCTGIRQYGTAVMVMKGEVAWQTQPVRLADGFMLQK